MTKSHLLVRPTAKTGRIHDVTPASAGWGHVGFGLHRLAAGEAYGEETGEREVCLVIVGGKGRFAVDGEDFGELGERMTPFEGAPWALYVPAGRNWAVDADDGPGAGCVLGAGRRGFPCQGHSAGDASAAEPRQGRQCQACLQYHARG